MAQATFKINQSFHDKLAKTKRTVESRVKDKLTDMAQYIVNISPNYSGAYVLSHSVKANNTRSRGRGRKSNPKPAIIGDPSNKANALVQLLGDIRAMDVGDLDKVTFRNDSPHARKVEDNPPPEWKNLKGPESNGSYAVYRRTRDKFR